MKWRCWFGRHVWLPRIWTGHDWLVVCERGCFKHEPETPSMKPLTLALICLGIVALRWRRAVREEEEEGIEPDDPYSDWLREFEQGPYLSIQMPADMARTHLN